MGDNPDNDRARQLALAEALMGSPHKSYWEKLGRFITQFTSLELEGQAALFRLSNVREDVAKEVFSGFRTDQAIQKIKAISTITNWSDERKAELEIITQQWTVINKMRNDIVHYGTNLTDTGELQVTNAQRVSLPTKLQIRTMNLIDLDHATQDLAIINLRLIALTWGHKVTPSVQKVFNEAQAHAWLYKPRIQGGSQVQRHANGKKPPRQRRASRG